MSKRNTSKVNLPKIDEGRTSLGGKMSKADYVFATPKRKISQ